ncbi:MAG: histidinol-phosphate transaminase [Lachnospirales bacterium]
MKNWIRTDLKDFVPYDENHPTFEHKINANESPFTLSEEIKKDLINWLEDENLRIYPDTSCKDLRSALGKHYNLNSENITCGVGSDALIDHITKGFLNNNDTVLIPTPSFTMYHITTKINHGKTIYYNLLEENNFDFDENELINQAKKENAKLIFMCNPNNPTGTVYSKEKVTKVIENVNALVVIDEAYIEFADENLSFINSTYNNIVVLRTFSKAFGLAGARVGFAVGSKPIIDVINTVKPPYDLNTLSQLLAIKAMENYPKYMNQIRNIVAERNRMYEEIKKMNIKIFKSQGNFLYLKSSSFQSFIDGNILVRKFGNSDYLRITVTTRDVNNKVLKILRSEKCENFPPKE